MGQQGAQEGTKHTCLRGPSVEGQCSRHVVAYPYHLGQPVRKSRIQLQREVFSPRFLSLVMSFVATMVLNAELLSMNSTHIGVPFGQVGKGNGECD
jgi:hypothetical protein